MSTVSTSGRYAGADSGDDVSSSNIARLSDLRDDAIEGSGEFDSKLGDVVVSFGLVGTSGAPNSGRFKPVEDGDIMPFSRTRDVLKLLCRVLGPRGAIWGRFRNVLERTALRTLADSDMIYRQLSSDMVSMEEDRSRRGYNGVGFWMGGNKGRRERACR